MVYKLDVRTGKRVEMLDITSKVREAVRSSGVKEGICYLYVPHTTAAITINEHADPSVAKDIEEALSKLVPAAGGYRHLEGNADAHIKATMVGPSEMLLVSEGRLLLGTWQGVFFCEFDGPRSRKVFVRILEG